MTLSRLTSGLVAGLLFALPVSAAEFVGVVTRVDPEKKELQVEGRLRTRGQSYTFALTPQTQVLFGSQPGRVDEIPVGRRVHVAFEGAGERPEAKLVRVNGSRPATTAPDAADVVAGVLRRVGLTDREVVVVGPGAKGPATETTVAVPESARLTRDGKAVGLDQFKEGDTVRVRVEKREGKPVAVAVEVGEPAKSDVVPKIRFILRLADGILGQMEGK